MDPAHAYHERWQEESALGEIKTDLRGRGEVLRSKTPDLVEQQMWGLPLAHYAIRALLVDAADEAGYDPTGSRSPAGYASCAARSPTRRPFPPERLRAAVRDAHAEILRHLLPPRGHRTCERVVKRARHNSYRVKRPTDKIIRHAGPPTPILACPNSPI